MKKLILCTLLACLFALGNTATAHSYELDGGIVLVAIISGKAGGIELEIICNKNSAPISIPIPQKYVDKGGNLSAPIEITFVQDGKLIHQGVSKGASMNVPLVDGIYELNIRIGRYTTSTIVSL